MKRSRYNKRRRRHVPVPIASMGDIAFLLIIFFMILSEFAKPNIEMDLPLSERVEKPEITAAVSVSMDENGQIYLDGEPTDDPQNVELYVRAILTNAINDDQRHVQFKADRALTFEDFGPVVKAIAEGGGIIQGVGELPK